MSGRALPTFLELLGPREGRTGSVLPILLGVALVVTVLIGRRPRSALCSTRATSDFPFAALTMAVVPFATLMLLNRPQEGCGRSPRRYSPACLRWRRLYTVFNEGIGQLAVAVDLRDVFPAGAYAVAGAGRANPKISSPTARPDSPIL